MTDAFDAWSAYYDAFYGDKDYSAEVDYVHALIGQHAANARSILDLGCGTGSHALAFAARGLCVHGVDSSAPMLERAKAKQAIATPPIRGLTSFSKGDVRRFRSDARYDVATSLFHVLSYQASDEDVLATFGSAAEALHPGGLLVFDYWSAPAVEAIGPELRTRVVDTGAHKITRVARPSWQRKQRTIEVTFEVSVENCPHGEVAAFQEHHLMRYFLERELRAMLARAGFDTVACVGWLRSSAPTIDDWSACIVARRQT